MKLFVSTLCAAAFAMSPVALSPAIAGSTTPLAVVASSSQASALDDLVQVQYGSRYQRDRRGVDRRRYDRRGYNDRVRRAQPRRHAPRTRSRGPDLGSAVVGAIVGGLIVNQLHQQPRAQAGSYLSHNHLNWCRNRWRSYRVVDNSYQPYNGPRRVCVSPYGPN